MEVRLAVVFVVACSSAPPKPEPPARPPAPTLFDQALASERGHGVPRDFGHARELYAQLCRQGDGDLRACSKFLEVSDRTGTSRGETVIRERMCQRGDKAGCLGRLINSSGKDDLTALRSAGIELDALPKQCAGGDVSACEFLLVADALASMASSRQEATPEVVDIATVMLHADPDMVFDATADACTTLLMGMCDSRGKEQHHDWDACLEQMETPYEGVQSEPANELATGHACIPALTHACDAGSVLACEPLTGRQVSSCVRCTAGDKRACRFSDATDCAK